MNTKLINIKLKKKYFIFRLKTYIFSKSVCFLLCFKYEVLTSNAGDKLRLHFVGFVTMK